MHVVIAYMTQTAAQNLFYSLWKRDLIHTRPLWNINLWLFQIKSFISACLFFHSLSPFTLKIICNTHSLSTSVHYSKLVNLAIVKAKVAMRSVKKFTSQHDKSVCSAKSWGQDKSRINACQSSTQRRGRLNPNANDEFALNNLFTQWQKRNGKVTCIHKWRSTTVILQGKRTVWVKMREREELSMRQHFCKCRLCVSEQVGQVRTSPSIGITITLCVDYE